MIRRMACLAALLLLALGVAHAETMEALSAQAQTPWRETIEAWGRTLTFDVEARLPQAERMGIYAVSTVGLEARMPAPQMETAPKRRGIALRRKETEVYPIGALPQDYAAFGNPYTAAQALWDAQTCLEPVFSQAEGTRAQAETVSGFSPLYLYDKNTGTWLETAAPGDVGEYHIDYALFFEEAPLVSVQPFYRDWEAWRAEGADADYPPCWSVFASMRSAESYTVVASLPCREETLRESVDFAPLERSFDLLRALAQEGYLRQVHEMRLVYGTFLAGAGEETRVLLKPVWAVRAEAYQSPELQARDDYGEHWEMEETILIDAQTGGLIERLRVDWPEKAVEAECAL